MMFPSAVIPVLSLFLLGLTPSSASPVDRTPSANLTVRADFESDNFPVQCDQAGTVLDKSPIIADCMRAADLIIAVDSLNDTPETSALWYSPQDARHFDFSQHPRSGAIRAFEEVPGTWEYDSCSMSIRWLDDVVPPTSHVMSLERVKEAAMRVAFACNYRAGALQGWKRLGTVGDAQVLPFVVSVQTVGKAGDLDLRGGGGMGPASGGAGGSGPGAGQGRPVIEGWPAGVPLPGIWDTPREPAS